jgi:hypothetical protein
LRSTMRNVEACGFALFLCLVVALFIAQGYAYALQTTMSRFRSSEIAPCCRQVKHALSKFEVLSESQWLD